MGLMVSVKRFLSTLRGRAKRWYTLPDQVAEAKILSAQILINQIKAAPPLPDIRAAEFKVFSQFGDDGIIQYLVHHTGIRPDERSFVEFGVENYEEANTRFLLVHNNWKGLVIDGSPAHIRHVRNDRIYWRHDLTALCAFIDADNIDTLISTAGFSGDIGLLSIDIDGNDYWVWDRIACVNPIIVVAEMNSVFGGEHAVTVPYDPGFYRGDKHYSHLYWGCSLKALELLAHKKGYALVGVNSVGVNAYFVRRDRLGDIPELSSRNAYVESRYRESRNRAGELTYLSGKDRLAAIRDLPVVDVETGRTVRIGDHLGA